MVKIKVYSFKRDLAVDVDIENVSEKEYTEIREKFVEYLDSKPAFQAIADAFVYAVELCADANPSDIWQHILYRTYLEEGKNEQSWKRTSGQGFEVAFAKIYNPRLSVYGIRLVKLTQNTAIKSLKEMGLTSKIEPSKIDIAIEGNCDLQGNEWRIFGIIHSKTSLAERIKDDAPASRIIMENGFVSLAITLDSKSFPPPHGDGVNYGELGGRTSEKGIKEDQPKRNYFERDGDFTNGYSYNLRTPESPEITSSGSRIKTLSFSLIQPDEFVKDLQSFWIAVKIAICKKMPVTKVE